MTEQTTLLDQERWEGIYKLMEHPSMLTPDCTEEPEKLKTFLHSMKILVIGAGGLGCEVLKDLALSGFTDIHVIDLDTIDISNLNRQFLFTEKDTGRPKAEVAAEFVNKRVEGCHVTPYVGNIKDKPITFYHQFDMVISGLDSVDARRWMNATLVDIARDGQIIPFIDGGSEGFSGQVRVILPTVNACYECGMILIPPPVTFPMCTIASNPRVPEHCVEWSLLEFPKAHDGRKPDGDKEEDVLWCLKCASERAEKYKIEGVDFKLTLGVIKHVIPAIASTNSIIAAMCVNEAMKIAMNALSLDNYCQYSGAEQPYTNTFEFSKNETCLVCADISSEIEVRKDAPFDEIMTKLKENPEYQMKNPSIQLPGGIPLYMRALAQTHDNLQKPVGDLFESDTELAVTDPVFPQGMFLRLKVKFSNDD
ncbi:putative ubiquitin-activating enzyme E1 C [Monocercomonoides exilis]|uniref:putative ubiquitin-activating enzyme E1 C n=1 Tax=Monocercomonoides exilis TaxID=2049356 RepID=UPI0035594670|nr:putative ubiquitin-activating enzyme E1 C [Monocercomonoides exilis]|eukprot:MONOS_8703.1-p1 / transcript=MONOS_8703.1 / gene=MONOS_8703 / organism=Monocercomonoides_exilis_PA203 / gene_product=ubiquitin-activating enzyme E1 C / transcript_product=ubiquitin-activating enzyme E1 C / location=Mono_scaffold00335:20988-22799(+) / protein_length=421 / sequence_SO=supercontig / SO=protein_coding / is_pseudo=false